MFNFPHEVCFSTVIMIRTQHFRNIGDLSVIGCSFRELLCLKTYSTSTEAHARTKVLKSSQNGTLHPLVKVQICEIIRKHQNFGIDVTNEFLM